MASSKAASYICVFVASLISLVASQGAGSLFNTLVNTQGGAAPSMDPSMNTVGSTGLGGLLNMPSTAGFSPSTGANTLPPNPSFPTLGGSGMGGMGGMGGMAGMTGIPGMMTGGAPLGAMNSPAPQQQSNPMGNIWPYLMFSGFDMSNSLMMMMMALGGGGGGQGGNSFMGNPLAMLYFGNNM